MNGPPRIPQERLAVEIAGSPSQAIALAQSLAELLDTFETEEVDLDRLPELFTADLAEHRNSILSFLSIIREKLPVELFMLGRLGPMERRSRLLRLEARRLAETQADGTDHRRRLDRLDTGRRRAPQDDRRSAPWRRRPARPRPDDER